MFLFILSKIVALMQCLVTIDDKHYVRRKIEVETVKLSIFHEKLVFQEKVCANIHVAICFLQIISFHKVFNKSRSLYTVIHAHIR